MYVNSRGGRRHKKFIPVWIKRTRWRPKKKGLQFKNFPNSGYRFKILANFHEFLSEDQKKKKKDLRPKTLMKSGVSPQKLRKYRR